MRRYISALKAAVPPLTHASHKGTAGRIAVVGGSLEYTGAPYFSAISAMRAGADLGHVFCQETAAAVIKGYSPELIVHPLLSGKSAESCDAIAAWLPRMHAIVVGPGLGRDVPILRTVKAVISVARKQQKSVVIDADGLFMVTEQPDIITGYTKAILTPNDIEFQHLYKKMFGWPPSPDEDMAVQSKALAAKMGNLTIVRKGKVDIITNGEKVIECHENGAPRRCGGQGDLLSGIIGLFSYWTSGSNRRLQTEYGDIPPSMLAAYGACFVVKKCAEMAYAKQHRAMLASDMVSEVGAVFYYHFESQKDVSK